MNGMRLINPYTRTLAILKPDIVIGGKVRDILSRIERANLSIVQHMFVQLNLDIVSSIYSLQVGQPSFPSLNTFLCSGPSLVLILEGVDVVRRWRNLMVTLRSEFSIDKLQNAVHGSDTEKTAFHEIDFWFDVDSIGFKASIEHPSLSLTASRLSGKMLRAIKEERKAVSPLKSDDTLVILKPLAVVNNYYDIMSIIKAHGFEVKSELKSVLDAQFWDKFYQISSSSKSFISSSIEFMAYSPIIALHLRRVGCVRGMLHLMGPTDLSRATAERPDCLHAMFSSDEIRNAVCGSDSYDNALKEISLFFGFTNIYTVKEVTLENPVAPVVPVSTEGKKKATPSPHPQSLISLADKQNMVNYLQNDIDQHLTGFITRTIISRPSEFYDFAIQDLSEQKHLHPKSATPGKFTAKLAPLELAVSQSVLTTEIADSQPGASPNKLALSIGKGPGPSVNQSIELFASLEQAKAEIDRLKASIAILSSNIVDI